MTFLEFFYQFFGRANHTSTDGHELHVKCPFPHFDQHGKPYYEENPSAHINTNDSVFHCKVCSEGMSEASFLAKIQNISWYEATRILKDLEQHRSDAEQWNQYVTNLKNSQAKMDELAQMGIADMVDELQIGFQGEGFAFPVFAYGSLLDIRTYRPRQKPKVLSEKGAGANILPFDLWLKDERPTLLCAGEKDMAIARRHRFNAITFTGGENAFPKLWKGSLKGKTIYIVYDNDQAGIDGAVRVATQLKEIGAFPYIATGHHQVCTEKGEDIHDFFQKYHKTAADLQNILDAAEPFSETDYQKQRNVIYPLVRIEESAQGKYSRRIVSSRVTVIAEMDEPMKIPAMVTFKKIADAPGTMEKDEERVWALTDDNLSDILYLCDSNLKENAILNNLKKLAKVPQKEQGIHIRKQGEIPIWKLSVTDDTESEIMDENHRQAELTLYSVGERLSGGGKYRIFYKSIAHPLQGMKVVGVTNHVEESDNSVTNFVITESVMDSLKVFQGSVEEKMKEMAERVKAVAGPETRERIAWTVDLFYHTPLEFMFGNRLERGYLDCMMIGDPRTGKSQTAKNLLSMYELGTFVSLKTATVGSLIGGSDSTAGGYRNKLGIIPQNHKGALILEEFSGAPADMISKLTELRSSNKVRIHRVKGTLTADAKVRMLTISNQKVVNGKTIPLVQYPDGVHVIQDLIGAAEDIARYDFFIFVERPDNYVPPTIKIDVEPYPKESYVNRVRWVWSRKANQIIIDEEVREYIVECANSLNKLFDTPIGFFGAEAWKKLSRVAIATAACTCSMDDTGELLVVKKEHVQWAARFLKDCYDNSLFKLRTYVDEERRYSTCTSKAIHALQGIYNTHRTLVTQMERATELTQSQLRAVSGLGNDDFNKIFNQLAEGNFFRWSGDKIIPSGRFRQALAGIKQTYAKRIDAE